MLYDTRKLYDLEKLHAKLRHLEQKGKVVELRERQTGRTLSQNAYHAICIQFVANEAGETYDYVNTQYYKRACNYDLFVRVKEDKVLGPVHYLRSSRDLTKEEMSLSIDRFRNWASLQLGLYIPDPRDKELAEQFIVEASKSRNI